MKTATTMLLCVAMLCACTKEGPEGQKGKQGDKGEQGPTGPQGIPGNAGVMMYVWEGPITFSGDYIFDISFLTEEQIRNSTFYAFYFNDYPESFPIPGKGWNPIIGEWYDTSYHINLEESYIDVWLFEVGTKTYYSKNVTWEEFRLIVVPIPSGNIITRSAPAIDFSNYSEVAAYYGLPE